MASQEAQVIKLFGTTISLHGRSQSNGHDQGKADQTPAKRPDKIIPCPRCKSTETKFCYFNNYNINQPRYFCKGCQRYWTAGGALRNVPIGAGRRKTKPPGTADACFDDGSGGVVHPMFDVDGMVVEEWSAAAEALEGFRHDYPMKRLRSSSCGQPY